MRNLILQVIGGAVLAAGLGLPAQAADVPRQASPGTLNYVEGQVSMAGQTLDAKSVGSAQLQPGESLTTRNGKAELLLTPGVFLRLGDNTSVEMISPNLTNTEVEIHQGEAMIEVAELHPQNNLRVDEDGVTTRLMKDGLYDFDANQNNVLVYKGEALVSVGDRVVKLKGGRQLAVGDADRKPQKFDKGQFEAGSLYQWASLRSSYVAEANIDAAAPYAGGGFYYPGWTLTLGFLATEFFGVPSAGATIHRSTSMIRRSSSAAMVTATAATIITSALTTALGVRGHTTTEDLAAATITAAAMAAKDSPVAITAVVVKFMVAVVDSTAEVVAAGFMAAEAMATDG